MPEGSAESPSDIARKQLVEKVSQDTVLPQSIKDAFLLDLEGPSPQTLIKLKAEISRKGTINEADRP